MSSSTPPRIVSTYSNSVSLVSTTSSSDSAVSSVLCFFDPSTCQRQSFSIPEKIVYYIANNVTNAKTYQKLVETCKYFFKVNPVIVVPKINCYGNEWDACYDEAGEYCIGLKYDQPTNFKLWVTHDIFAYSGDASQMIPLIYKNDAKSVVLRSQPLKLDEFLFLAGNVEELSMWEQSVKNENGEIIQLEDIVKSLSKLKKLDYALRFDGADVNCNTVRKLMGIEHFKQFLHLEFYNVSEVLEVEEMFNLIIEYKHILIDICYREEISNANQQLVQQYSNRLKNEEGCNSTIGYGLMDYGTFSDLETTISEDDNFDDENVSDHDEKEDFLFPWNNEGEEEWELPWDQE